MRDMAIAAVILNLIQNPVKKVSANFYWTLNQVQGDNTGNDASMNRRRA